MSEKTRPADGAPTEEKEVHMAIQWRHDFDNVFQEAKERNRPILLDFNAAPM
ncbi:MAG: hypothetical protein ACE15D_02375 [Candidatus Eisenbacteria bacterium]|nr:hypothetical protein [Candidatus Eisenbacteria bacterium]